jgi:hypothetical protein
MAGGTNLSVTITAEIADLQSKMTLAKSSVQALETQMRTNARTALEAGQSNLEFADSNRQLASDIAVARTGLASLNAEWKKATSGIAGLGHAAASAHGGIGTIARETHALFDELSSGRTNQSFGTISTIGMALYAMSPAALAAAAGVGVLGAGMAYFAERTIAAGKAVDQLHLASLASGIGTPRAQLQGLTDELAKLPDVGQSSALEIEAALSKVPLSLDAMSVAARLAAENMRRTGVDAKTAGEEIASALDPSRTVVSVAEMVAKTTSLTQVQVAAAQKADEQQNVIARQVEKLNLLAISTDRARAATAEYTQGMGQWWGRVMDSFAAAELHESGIHDQVAMQGVETHSLEENAAAWTANAAARQAALSRLAAQPAQAPLTFQMPDLVGRMREQMQEVAAVWDGTQSGLLAKQQSIAAQYLAQVASESKAAADIRQEESRLTVEYRREAGNEAIAATREQIAQDAAAVQGGTLQRLQAEKSSWEQLLAGARLTAGQRLEVEHTIAGETVQIARELTQQQLEIARSAAETDITIARQALESKRDLLASDFEAFRINADRKLALTQELIEKEHALDVKRLQDLLPTLQQQPVEAARVADQIRLIDAKKDTELSQAAKQHQADMQREAQQQVTVWKGVVTEIESAEQTLVSNILSRRKSLTASLAQLAGQLVEKEIAADLKAVTTSVLLHQQGDASKKALEQGGLVYHMLMKGKEATTDTALQGQQTAAIVAGQAAQTAAVTAGTAAQTTAVVSGAAASKAATATLGKMTITQDAAKAAAGAYAAVSAIPLVGPVLAPVAAGVAYTGVMAFESLASLDVGAWDVPRDMVAQIHEGEMVVPTTYAQGMRAAGGVDSSAPGGGGDTHIHNHSWNIQTLDADSFRDYIHSPAAMQSIGSALRKAYAHGMRP